MILAMILAAGSVVLIWNQPRVFDFDMSAFMDAGWRVLVGQAPYVDFYYNAGPVHLYMHALFFALFGFGRTAIVAHLLTVNAVAVLATYVIARKYVALPQAAMCAALCAIAYAGPIAHPWYDQNAWMWIVLGAMVFEMRDSYPAQWRVPMAALGAGAATALAFMTKANIGLAGGLALGLAILVAAKPIHGVVWYIVGGLLMLGALILTLPDPGRFVDEAFLTYAPAARIGKGLDLFRAAVFTPYLWILLTGWSVAILGFGRGIWQRRVPFVLFSGLGLASIFAIYTGSMMPIAYTAPFGIVLTLGAASLLCTSRPRKWPRLTSRWFVVVWTLLVIDAGLGSWHLAVWSWRAPNWESTYRMRTPAMAGWYTSEEVGRGIDEVVSYLDSGVPREDTVFVFPDSAVIYGLSGRNSYKPAPFIFHLGEFPAPGHYAEEFRGHFLSNPPRWIVMHHQAEVKTADTSKFLRYLQLDGFVQEHYRQEWVSGTYSILRLSS